MEFVELEAFIPQSFRNMSANVVGIVRGHGLVVDRYAWLANSRIVVIPLEVEVDRVRGVEVANMLLKPVFEEILCLRCNTHDENVTDSPS